MYEGHHAPVTGIDTNTVQTSISFSHLFLTSSFDWTIKLWNMKVEILTSQIERKLYCTSSSIDVIMI